MCPIIADGLQTAHYSIDFRPYETEIETESEAGVFRSTLRSAGYKLEFDVRFPYEAGGVMMGSGEPEEVGLILTKGKAFTGDPNGSCWSEQSIPVGIIFLFDTNLVTPILQAQLELADSMRNLEHVPDETAEAFYHFRFDIDQGLWYKLVGNQQKWDCDNHTRASSPRV